MTNSIYNTSEIRRCDACGKDFFDPFFIENEQDRKVAECFQSTLADGKIVYAHGLCLIIAAELNCFFSQKYKYCVDISKLELPEIDDAVDYATETFYPELSQKMDEVAIYKINDLVTFFQHCEGKHSGRKRKREIEVEQGSSSVKKPRTSPIVGSTQSLKPSQILIKFNSKSKQVVFKVIFNNGLELENFVSLQDFYQKNLNKESINVLKDQKIPVIIKGPVTCTTKLVKEDNNQFFVKFYICIDKTKDVLSVPFKEITNKTVSYKSSSNL